MWRYGQLSAPLSLYPIMTTSVLMVLMSFIIYNYINNMNNEKKKLTIFNIIDEKIIGIRQILLYNS